MVNFGTSQVTVVGIGASAGGLKSIEMLFDRMPIDTGMAFVIIQHLSPNHKSLMPEILSRHTRMPVVLATEEMTVEENHVYVIPPGKELRCVGLSLVITDLPDGLHRPIDTFFISLAINDGIPAIGIVLSGTGSDGSEGISAIHGAGGLTIAESIETAEFDGMPVSAERTGCVDLTLSPADIPDAIRSFQEQKTPAETILDSDLSGVQLIFSLLEEKFGLLFEQYKPRTIARRLERRQLLGHFRDVIQYAEYVREHPDELEDLFYDLLIGVTKFFRDNPAFEHLEEEINASLELLPPGETYRVWVVGCATGEEAYSIAMLVLDAFERMGRQPELKVFATDVHHRSLELAARGEFDESKMKFVSLEQQRRYFDRLENGDFRVNPTVRKHLVFANHNAIQDAPFTNIHLVSCRNVLIYLRNSAQVAMLASFHFALVAKGLLFLGGSETLGQIANEFDIVDQRYRIYRKLRNRRSLLSQASRAREVMAKTPINILNRDTVPSLGLRSILDVYESLITTRIKLGLLLDHRQNVIHAIGDVGGVLKNASGRFRGLIGDFLDAQARSSIIAAVAMAAKEPGTNYVVEQVQPDNDRSDRFDVGVLALTDSETTSNIGWIIQFEPVERIEPKTERLAWHSDDAYKRMETELEFTRENLNTSVEQLEASNEELQATNEEMVASNEELQSTNEELHSVNAELHSVNAELHRKITELEETTNDLEAFLGSSDIGTIFLDRDLRIRKYTKAVNRYFDLMPFDMGRPLSNFTNKLGLDNLDRHLRDVLQTGTTFSTNCKDSYGDLAYVKVSPYLAGETISGVVLTILGEGHVASEPSLFVTSGEVGVWEWPDVDRDEMWWSPACYRLIGLDPELEKPTFSRWKQQIHPEDSAELLSESMPPVSLFRRGTLRVRLQCRDKQYRYFEFRSVCRLGESGEVNAVSGTISNAGLHKTHAVEAQRIKRLEKTVEDFQDFVYAVSHDLQGPLRQVRQAVELLSSPGTDDVDLSRAQIQTQIGQRADKLEKLLSAMLQYSRIYTRGESIKRCDTEKVVREVVDEFAEIIEAERASVHVNPLPSVHADANQLRTVFWHLIDNALKYRRHVPLEIEILCEEHQSGPVITVKDNGIGIGTNHLSDVFVIFRRLGFADDVDGIGLGLALCKRIVLRHGGWIWAESTLAMGTEIKIRMPVTKTDH